MTQPAVDVRAPSEPGLLPLNAGLVERSSRAPFGPTVERLSQAILAAGMQIFAVIDHAANARGAGLEMPPSTVIIYGKAAAGTPIMLDAPRSALDLPLRVLIRADSHGQTVVAFHPIGASLEAAGVSASVAARLEPAQHLLLAAIER